MIKDEVVKKVLSISDFESGGDNALDGFEFQVSAAIYLVFEEIQQKNDFKLVYEKLEDFIIFTDEINLYQAKSINQNLTPVTLYKAAKKRKAEESSLSIIEKMYNNYLAVKEKLTSNVISNTLIICASKEFSKKLSDLENIKELKKLNFNDLKDKSKQEIISNTQHDQYNWIDIKARRLIPKISHEEVTRSFIEDVINDVLGENKLKSKAIYNSLTNEIRKIRKQKSFLTNEFILQEIWKYSTFEDDVDYKDYVHLLQKDDQQNIQLNISFNAYKNYIKINNHPAKKDYELIANAIKKSDEKNIDDIFFTINNSPIFRDLLIRLDSHEIKALILLCIIKECY